MATLGADLRNMQDECYTEKTRLIGHHELDGSGDGMQVILGKSAAARRQRLKMANMPMLPM